MREEGVDTEVVTDLEQRGQLLRLVAGGAARNRGVLKLFVVIVHVLHVGADGLCQPDVSPEESSVAEVSGTRNGAALAAGLLSVLAAMAATRASAKTARRGQLPPLRRTAAAFAMAASRRGPTDNSLRLGPKTRQES